MDEKIHGRGCHAQDAGDHPRLAGPPQQHDAAGCGTGQDAGLGSDQPVPQGDCKEVALHHGDQAGGRGLRDVLDERRDFPVHSGSTLVAASG